MTDEHRDAVLRALGRLVLQRVPATVERVAADTGLTPSKTKLILRGLSRRKRGDKARSLSNGTWTVIR